MKTRRSEIWFPIVVTALATLIGLLIMSVAKGEVNSGVDWIAYDGNGSQTAFTFPFGIMATSQLRVVVRTVATGVEQVLAINSQYSLVDDDNDGDFTDGPGGTVNMITESGGEMIPYAWSSAYEINISRMPALTQTTDFDSSLRLRLSVLEDAFDGLVYQTQYLRRLLYRAALIPETEAQIADMNLPNSVERASSTFTFDANGDPYMAAGTVPPSAVVVSSFWKAVLDDYNLPASLVSMTVPALIRAFLVEDTELGAAETLLMDGRVDVRWFGAVGDGTTDDTNAIQAAIDYAILNNRREILIPAPDTAYRVTDTLTFGSGTAVVTGLRIVGAGLPKILWDGDANGLVVDAVSLDHSVIQGLWIDGNDTAGVTGMKIRAAATFPSQGVVLDQVAIENCAGYGLLIVQDANATCDYFTLVFSTIWDCGIDLRITGDARQVTALNCWFLTATTYAVDVNEGCFSAIDSFFGRSGTADIYAGGPLSGVSLANTKHESQKLFENEDDAASYSPLAPGIVFDHVSQDLFETPWTAQVAVDYNCYKPFKLIGCHFIGDVNIGSASLAVISELTEFVPEAYSGIHADFTDANDKVMQIGRGTDGYANLYVGPLSVVTAPPWPAKIGIRSLGGDWTQGVYSDHEEPNSPYYVKGDLVFNFFGDPGDPWGWRCVVSGGGEADPNTMATFEALMSGTTTVPGGADTQVQFNDGDTFGGDSGLTYNKTTDTLSYDEADWTGGNTIYVPLAGDIQTYVTAAAAGDTLILASGQYVITSSITVAKQLNIVGQGHAGFLTTPVTYGHGTLISSTTAAVSAFDITSSNVRIANLSINLTGAGSTGVAIANNLTGEILTSLDIIVNGTGATRAMVITGSNVVIRDVAYYATSSDDGAAGLVFQNNSSTTQNAVLDGFTVTGNSQGTGASYAWCAVANNDNDLNTLTMNLSNSVFKSPPGSAIDVAVAIYSTTTNTATINCYMCTLDGADYDVLNTGTNVLNVGGSVLVNNKTSGTITYRTAVTAGNYLTATETTLQDKTIIKTISLNDDASADDYQFDDDAANATKQTLTLTNILPAYAEAMSVQVRCFETVTGSTALQIDAGTTSGGSELCTGSPDTANDIIGLGAGGWPYPAATNAARSLYVSGTPGANWNTLNAGRWSVIITYTDWAAAHTQGIP